MGELEGTYRVLQTPGTRLGSPTPAGISTLEPGQGPLAAAVRPTARTHVQVQLLDDSVEVFDIEPKCNGQVLLTQVWGRLNLIECDYFGLEFQNAQSCWIWLEPMKPIVRQVRRPKNAVLRLAVKFFPPDPGQLQEEYTRYLFALQLKRDLLEERLTCTDTTAALLASHLLQAEIGDYDEALDREHLQAREYLPRQERALGRILQFHRQHAGQTPAESDFQVLEIARKLEMYGIRFHTASDREGAKINLAVSHMGILVFQSSTKINTFNWSRVRKLSFKRKRFLIKLHPEAHGPHQDTLEFVLGSRDACKNFWKICVEYHTFFRLFDQPKPRAKAVLFSRGSSFRYSGRTQKQLVDYVKDGGMKRIPYERRRSKTRMSLRAPSADVLRQSVSFTEGMRTPASPSSTGASFHSVPTSPPALPCLLHSNDRGGGSPAGPPAPGARRPAAERNGVAAALPPGPPALQPCQGLSVESPHPPPSTQKSPPSLSPLGPAKQGSTPLLSPVLSDTGGAGMDDQEEPRYKLPLMLLLRLTEGSDDGRARRRGLLRGQGGARHRADAPEGPGSDHRVVPQRGGQGGRHARGADAPALLRRGPHLRGAQGLPARAGAEAGALGRLCRCPGPGRSATHRGRAAPAHAAAPGAQRPFPAAARSAAGAGGGQQAAAEAGGAAPRLRAAEGLLPAAQRLPAEAAAAPAPLPPAAAPPVRPRPRPGPRPGPGARRPPRRPQGHHGGDLLTPAQPRPAGEPPEADGAAAGLGWHREPHRSRQDMLLYTSRGASGTSHFRIRGLLPLRGMLVEEGENEWSVPHCFTICAAQKTVVVAAGTQLEKDKWVCDLKAAIDAARSGGDTALVPLGSLLCALPRRPASLPGSVDEVPLEQASEDDARSAQDSLEGPGQHRANTTVQVCWYRNTSVSRADHSAAVENQLSGYLLRKFKNSNGWQKLWVVFTNFCLFFYKTHQDDYPLASLPLLGYRVSLPREADGIHREHVFKLQFKSHVYFFRAESKYTFGRWMEVIESTSTLPGRARTPEEEA
ncbi:FERM, ARHGEF and pleckstrin domain-containing protein 2 isoform X6 [Hippopotamus amphibius kiboko]|uniref:FERM, ARHGEF and pleckstrin domain-containing protein 2 isoform X6 n=1 Tax=Hippopotamus amphibius kiboko TaxID=575201 RepID=UPI002598CA9B|nr:FERM, ARHGEF and pleckstrin domain-containing protein 2 isoform X6 [Hippopotamus amphibius kiboko]